MSHAGQTTERTASRAHRAVRPELSRYTFRRLANAELPLVNAFYNRLYHAHRSIAQAEWQYQRNPYGEAIIFGAFDSRDQLVGMRPAIASRLFWRGQEKAAYQLIDAGVAPQHRNRGIFTQLVKLMCTLAETNNFALYSFSNDESASVYRKTAWLSFLGRCENRVQILSWHSYVGYQLRKKLGLDGRSPDGAAPGEPPNALRDGDLCLVPISRFDSDYEEIHAELGRTVPSFTLRRKEFLNWRFFGNAERAYRVAVVQQSGRPQGYVAIRMLDRIAHVIDLFVAPDVWAGGTACCLLSRWARELGAIAVYFHASEGNFFQCAFATNVPVPRRVQKPNIFLDTNSVRYLASLQGRPVTMRDFYFAMSDGDVI